MAIQSNCWQGFVLSVAASQAGVALSPLSARISPTLAINLFDQVKAKGILIEGDLLRSQEWRDAFALLSDRLGGRCVMVAGEVPAGFGYEKLPTLEAASLNGRPIAQRARDPGRTCLVLSTGGSTGVPKSVMHCENTLFFAALGMGRATDYSDEDVYVAFGPYGHATGSLFDIYMPLLYGGSALPNARWRAENVVDAIGQYGGTYCITVGTHIFDLLALPPEANRKLASMRVVISGAGPDQLFVDAENRFGFTICRDYGLTECMGHAAGRPADPPATRLHKEGVPFPGIKHRILDPQTGKPAGLGVAGEYSVRGPSMFMGYFGQPDLTRASLDDEGYYRTGDLMMETDDGYLRWVGRMKDVIRRGGLQIDVLEMENTLAQHPKIAEVAVVGEPHPRLGEQAVVVVVVRDKAAPPSLDELVAFLQTRGIPKECLPGKLALAPSLPTTEWGKFNRPEIRKWLAEQPAG